MSTYIPPPPPNVPDFVKGGAKSDIRTNIPRLLRYFGKYRIHLVAIIVMSLVVSLLTILGPQYLGQMTDTVSEAIQKGTVPDMAALGQTAILLVVLYSVATVIQAIHTRMAWNVEEINGDMLRMELSRKVSRIPVGTMDRMRTGDVMSRFVNDTDTIRLRSVDCIANTIEAVAMIIGCLFMMAITDWRMTVAVMAPTIVGFAIIRYVVKRSQKYYRAQSKDLGRMNSLIEETYRGLDTVKVYNGMGDVRKEFDSINDNLRRTAFKARFMSGLMPETTGFVNNLSYVLVCIVGSVLILEGESTYGALVAFIVYVKLVNQPLMRISNSLGSLQEVSAACERIFEFLDTPEMPPEDGSSKAPVDVKGEVVFKDVHFSYNKGTEVIHGLDLHVKAGERVAIVGPTGAGKTTVSNLLLRFYDVDSGSVSIDGRDIRDITRGDLRDMFGTVLQDTWLFKGTIRQNIVFGRNDISEERIMQACEAVGLMPFVSSHKDGIDTYLEDPQRLSSGQRQQIAIARAVVKDAPLLIMDEATSSVDTRTERHIQEAMDRLMSDRTSFVIAHRLSTIIGADTILVMRKGEIIEKGSHEELLAKGGFYKSLYDSQFEYCD